MNASRFALRMSIFDTYSDLISLIRKLLLNRADESLLVCRFHLAPGDTPPDAVK